MMYSFLRLSGSGRFPKCVFAIIYMYVGCLIVIHIAIVKRDESILANGFSRYINFFIIIIIIYFVMGRPCALYCTETGHYKMYIIIIIINPPPHSGFIHLDNVFIFPN